MGVLYDKNFVMKKLELWKEIKKENSNKLILLQSWIFFITFDDDAKFLSAEFGFQIQVWKTKSESYYRIWFPISGKEKYINSLKSNWISSIWIDGEWKITDKQKWLKWINDKIFRIDESKLVFKKVKTKTNLNEITIKSFIYDLEQLIIKYKQYADLW